MGGNQTTTRDFGGDLGETVIPRSLSASPPSPFVGRTEEMAALESLLPVRPEDPGRLVLVSGRPGSGKTRLLREFALRAAGRGAVVLYGACDAVVNAPHQPFVEGLELLLEHIDRHRLPDLLGTGPEQLARLLPGVASRLDPIIPTASLDADAARYRLHAAVTELLDRVGRHKPVLLILDDVHGADTASLHLMRHLARSCGGMRLLLAVAFRDRDPAARPEFAQALVDLLRIDGVARLALPGLTDGDVAELLRRLAGVEDADVSGPVQAVMELTDGNPFLLCELWRALVDAGNIEITDTQVRLTRPITELASPDTIREIASYRVAQLSAPTGAMLEVASVIGSAFEPSLLTAVMGVDDETLGRSLDEAIRSGMIDEEPGPNVAYRFGHELVRRALYDRLPSLRRARLHLQVGESLEALHAADTDPFLVDLAHHFSASATVGGRDKAVEYNLKAAEVLLAALAFGDGAAHLTTALDLGIADPARRFHARFDLGRAQHWAGRTTEALATFRSLAVDTRNGADAEALARVAIAFEEASSQTARPAQVEAARLLEEAASAIGHIDSPLRARTLAWFSRALAYTGDAARASDARAEAVEIATRVGDEAALGAALLQTYLTRGSTPLEDVVAMLQEARRLGQELGDADLHTAATAWLVPPLVDLCDLDGARQIVAGLLELAAKAGQLFYLYFAELAASALALCAGQLAEAESRAHRSWQWTLHMSGPRSTAEYGVQMFGIRREQGRLAELKPAVETLTRAGRDVGAWRPGLVVLLAELGQTSQARRYLHDLHSEDFATLPHDHLRLCSLTYLADACTQLTDASCAADLYEQLSSLSGGNVLIGQVVACYGAADRYLGMLAGVLREWDRASTLFERALHLNQRMGAHLWAAHTQYQWARTLLRRGRRVDQQRATPLLAEAGRTAARLKLRSLTDRLHALGAVSTPRPSYPDGLTTREVEILRLVAEGLSNREIGSRLFISEHTAANHIRSILQKTGRANRADATSYAHRHGLA